MDMRVLKVRRHPEQGAPALDDLVQLVTSHVATDGVHDTAVPQLQLIRASAPGQPLPAVYQPGICIVLQGRKQAVLGTAKLLYDPLHYLVVGVTMLPQGQVLEASASKPYLCARINIDPSEIRSFLLQHPDLPVPVHDGDLRGFRIARVDDGVLQATRRLLHLLHEPRDGAVLGPLARTELLYRVLTGALGGLLRQSAAVGTKAHRMAAVVEQVRRSFAEPLHVEELARRAHMSASTLHLHFKQMTSMSPLQYQKHLRLHEARRLMLAGEADAAAASHRVGYESPSQFSREYKRLFGAPPIAEVRRSSLPGG